MPSFKPFSSVAGRNSASLFEIRLDNDFIVFRGSEYESAGQTLKGAVVLCLSSPLKVESVHLRLTGDLRFSYGKDPTLVLSTLIDALATESCPSRERPPNAHPTQPIQTHPLTETESAANTVRSFLHRWDISKSATTGISSHKVDRHVELLKHRWRPFVGSPTGEKTVLDVGNYEWPFSLDLSGDMPESVEGIPEAKITYRLKATVVRGKLSHDLVAHKPLRVIRTLEPAALEFLHAMSVENIWPNKVDYSIVIPQKAVVFGATIPLEMRFTPLLKGLELGDITVRLLEIRECTAPGIPPREHKVERQVSTWSFNLTREENWQDMIGDTGQEGWMATKKLDLPRRLRQCVQDVNHHGIKIRHKLKLVVALQNPDGHISELRATLPVSIFISPNMPLDEHGVLVDQAVGGTTPPADTNTIAPPGYGEHVLDQLFEDVEQSGLQTPGIASGISSPFYSQSRVGSSENLAALGGMTTMHGVPPAALSSRLQNVSLDPADRNASASNLADLASSSNPPTSHPSQPTSAALSRHNSAEDESHTPNPYPVHLRSGRASPEHVECIDLVSLSKVPSYTTALRTPARSRAPSRGETLPDYFSATSVSASAPTTPMLGGSDHGLHADPLVLTVIPEGRTQDDMFMPRAGQMSPPHQRPAVLNSSQRSNSLNNLVQHAHGLDDRRLHLIQARDRVY